MTPRALWLASCLVACSTAGTAWMEEPLSADGLPLEEPPSDSPQSELAEPTTARTSVPPMRTVSITEASAADQPAELVTAPPVGGGRSLGTFRNTYYDFPSEADFDGPSVSLYDRDCKALASVPRGFYEAVCVQGSGTLRRGPTVSFSRRDCSCADVCPRTGQKICFDQLDARDFPWGRGAAGKAITPLLTVAVDPDVLPLGTALFVPELAGLPRDTAGTTTHDGCFVAQDKGLKVKGKHIDVFTGDRSLTALWNQRVPSNRGVTVVLDSPRCARAHVP